MTISALDVASGLLKGLRDYYKQLIAAPNAVEVRPVYLGARLPSHVYVQPDLLRRQRVLNSRNSGSGDASSDRRAQPRPNERSIETRDFEETALYGERVQEIERRESWATIYARLSHATVILGPPGQGKTQLTAMAVRQIALEESERIRNQSCGLSALRLPIPMSCKQLANDTGTGELAIVQAVQNSLNEQCAPVVRNYIVSQLQQERTWIFLDALDEITEEDRECFRARLATVASWSCRLILTSRPYGYASQTVPLTQITELRLAPFSVRQTEEFTRRWFSEAQRQVRMHELIHKSASVRALSQNPFLLTLLCAISEDESIKESVTRTELYEKAVCHLMGGPDRLRDWQRMLIQIAWTAFCQNPAANRISDDQLMDLLTESDFVPIPLMNTDDQRERRMGLLDLSKVQRAELLRRELVQRGVLIPSKSEGKHVFPHRSILEYLTARSLMEKLKKSDAAEWGLVDRNWSWDPNWEQVILFLAGKLSEHEVAIYRLITTLSNRRTDDAIHYRLLLAAKCLSELPGETLAQLRETVEDITERTLSWWERSRTPISRSAVSALARVKSTNGHRLVTRLLEGLRNRNAWSELFSKVENEGLQPAATEALLAIGPAPDREDLVRPLLELLHNEDRVLQMAAVGPLVAVGATVDRADIVSRLLQSLRDPDYHVWRASLNALLAIGPEAYCDDILSPLLQWLSEPNHPRSLSTLRAIGPGAARADVLDRLLQLLHGSTDTVELYSILMTLREMGPAAARDDILQRLLELLSFPDFNTPRTAAEVLGELGSAAARSDILQRLLELLNDSRDSHERIVTAAAAALVKLDTGADQFQYLAILSNQLSHPRFQVRLTALRALADLGKTSARSDIVDRLLDLLHDSRLLVHVAETLFSIGPPAARTDISARLTELLDHEDWVVQLAALKALGAMGANAVQSKTLRKLITLLPDEHRARRDSVLEEKLEAQLERQFDGKLISRLSRLDHDRKLGYAAAAALENIGRDGVRLVHRGSKKLAVSSASRS